MCASILGFQAPLLRSIADDLKLPKVSAIAVLPGVQDVYRITVHFFDGRACHSVATLRRSLTDGMLLETFYQHALGQQPLTRQIEEARYDAFVKALKSIHFDKMPDQPDLPAHHSTDLWLVERAAGNFRHSVILAPDEARDDFSRLANAVKNGLPEALRIVK